MNREFKSMIKFALMKNDLLLRAARGEQTERVPVWLMRQAGRILPGYRMMREEVKDFKTLVKTPELACQATLEPVELLGVDAAIIFSDILVVPEAMGLNYEMVEAKGPYFEKTVKTQKDVDNLVVGTKEDWGYVCDAIRLVRKELDGKVPLIGFAGSPWTVFAYMVEGKGSKTFSIAKRMLYQNNMPSLWLLKKITETTIQYLKDQVEAGAQIVQIFDSWAGLLSPEDYAKYSLPFIELICHAMKDIAPVIFFPKGAFSSVESIKNIQCDVVSLDWTVPPALARKLLPGKALQGNLDPCCLYGDSHLIRTRTEKMIREFGTRGYIANLGHGVYPDTPIESVQCFIETVKSFVSPN